MTEPAATTEAATAAVDLAHVPGSGGVVWSASPDGCHVNLLVRRFYQAAIPDPLLGPIFHDFGVDWSIHIPTLVDYWAARLLDRPGYVGNAVGAHQPVLERCGFGDRELDRWVELWEETVDE